MTMSIREAITSTGQGIADNLKIPDDIFAILIDYVKITDETGNKTVAMYSLVCKGMEKAVSQILWRRTIVMKVYDHRFCPDDIVEIKALRKDMYEDIKTAIKHAVGKPKVVQYGQWTTLYQFEGGQGEPTGQVAVTYVRKYWLEVEIYSAGRSRYIKKWTRTYFATYDTRGKYLAVDAGDGKDVRVKSRVCMAELKNQIIQICL